MLSGESSRQAGGLEQKNRVFSKQARRNSSSLFGQAAAALGGICRRLPSKPSGPAARVRGSPFPARDRPGQPRGGDLYLISSQRKEFRLGWRATVFARNFLVVCLPVHYFSGRRTGGAGLSRTARAGRAGGRKNIYRPNAVWRMPCPKRPRTARPRRGRVSIWRGARPWARRRRLPRGPPSRLGFGRPRPGGPAWRACLQ